MNKYLPILIALALLAGCKRNEPANPTAADRLFNNGYAIFYGNYYDYLGIPENVLALSLFSPNLSVDTAGYYVGAGTHLVLSDIFISPTDTLLPAGHYTCSDTGEALTFLDGKDYDGNPIGAYMLIVTESGYHTEVLTNGSFDLTYHADTTQIDFTFTRPNGRTYTPTYRGILPTYIQSER